MLQGLKQNEMNQLCILAAQLDCRGSCFMAVVFIYSLKQRNMSVVYYYDEISNEHLTVLNYNIPETS